MMRGGLAEGDVHIVPTTGPSGQLSIPVEQQGFDSSQYMTGDWLGLRPSLDARGIDIEPYLIVDYSKVFTGGLDTHGYSIRERFNLPVQIDMGQLCGLNGGTFFAVLQVQRGGNASQDQVGDAQNFSFGTDADGRTQLGQIWYEQQLPGHLRIRAGKLDGNTDFDVLDDAADFNNNSFQTSPTLYLLPSFPDTGMGTQIFFEPEGGFYAGAGVFDGSGARGVRTGEYGPSHFFDRPDDLFYIAEIGQRYKLAVDNTKLPGKIGVGGWYDTNHFPRFDGDGSDTGTGGTYFILDQFLWKPRHEKPTPGGPTVNEQPEEEEYPGGIAGIFSTGWEQPTVNTIDWNVLGGLTWIGAIPTRPIDDMGVGATYAQFSQGYDTRNPYELAIESFYRIRFTQWISLKPDLQYIANPSGSGMIGQRHIGDALVFDLRLEISF